MSSTPSSTVIPALNLIANLAALYPPLSGLPVAVSVLSSAVAAVNSLSNKHTNSFNGGTPLQAASGLCTHCNVRPRYFDGTNTLPFCGKTCASNAGTSAVGPPRPARAQILPSPPQSTNCQVCKVKPKYHDGNKLHPYCSKACAAKGNGNAGTVAPVVTGASHLCEIPGCQMAAYRNNKGVYGRYCSKAHKELSKDACLTCKKVPKKLGHFCSKKCATDAEKMAPAIIEIPDGHVTFQSVTDQFKATWKNGGKACPTVRKIYKIIATKASDDQYEKYRDGVEARGQFKAAGRPPGNENRRWHGTLRQCKFGDPGNTQPCASTACPLCCIVKTSFDVGKLKNGSYGKGIYSSSTSSLSDGFSRNSAASTLKAMMLNKVVVGKAHKVNTGQANLTAPPAGFDSVIADWGKGVPNDELVVFTNDAIRPSYLLMYDA